MDLSGRSIKARRDGNGVVPSWSLARCKSPEEVQPLVKELEGIFTLKERASGWPRLAVVERTVVGHTATVPVNGYDLTLRRHFVVNPWFREALAFIPLWSGFLQDTAVFGFGWMALIGCGRLVRRRRRAAKGVCPKCRYDLRGLAGGVCPECGSAVKGM